MSRPGRRSCQDSCKYLIKKDLCAFAYDRTVANARKVRGFALMSPKAAKSR